MKMDTKIKTNFPDYGDSFFKDLEGKGKSSVAILFEPSSNSRMKERKSITVHAKREWTFGQAILKLKSELQVDNQKTLFFSVGAFKTINLTMLVGDIFDRYKNKQDEYLYVKFSEVETFG